MRTLGTNLEANLGSSNRRPQWLIRLGSLRYCSVGNASGNNVIYASQTWVKLGFEVSPFDDHAMLPGFVVTFQLPQTLKSTFSAIQPSDTAELYATAALSSFSGSNNVVKLYDGTVGGGWSLQDNTFQQDVNDLRVWPTKLAGPNTGLTEIATPGMYQLGSATSPVTLVLERGF